MRIKSYNKTIFYILIFPLFVILGGIAHELLGHGLVGLLVGGKLNLIYICGFEVTSDIRWVGWLGSFGGCDISEIPTQGGKYITSLAGSTTTFIISIVAFLFFWFTNCKGFIRVVLFYLSSWCFDMFLYLLPCFGIPHYIIGGEMYSEPYEAATNLGFPGMLFLISCLTVIAIITTGLFFKTVKTAVIPAQAGHGAKRRAAKRTQKPPFSKP